MNITVLLSYLQKWALVVVAYLHRLFCGAVPLKIEWQRILNRKKNQWCVIAGGFFPFFLFKVIEYIGIVSACFCLFEKLKIVRQLSARYRNIAMKGNSWYQLSSFLSQFWISLFLKTSSKGNFTASPGRGIVTSPGCADPCTAFSNTCQRKGCIPFSFPQRKSGWAGTCTAYHICLRIIW